VRGVTDEPPANFEDDAEGGTATADAPPAEAWEQLGELIDSGLPEAVVTFLRLLPPDQTSYTVSHLPAEKQSAMLAMLSEHEPAFAADLMEHFADEQSAQMLDQLEPGEAAAIVDQMDSDEQVDVLSELAADDAEAILEQMDAEEAVDVQQRLQYAEDTAGGLMITEYLAYPADQDVDSVLADLRANADRYNEFEVRYLYMTDGHGGLAGVVPMRCLVMAKRGQPLVSQAIEVPATVDVDAHADELEDIFDRVDYSALPVLDREGCLAGVVQRAAVREAQGEVAEQNLAKFGGIIRGEELRSMPLSSRAARRLMYLLPIMLLMIVSASIIALFEGTVEQLPILAAFLPVVAGVCGSGGFQSVAVTMRETSLGLVDPRDTFLVMRKEIAVGAATGLLLGAVLCGIVWVWRGSLPLAVVIGGAIPLVTVIAKAVGGAIPLVLQKIKLDPAMASGPVLTTVVDLASFLTTLALASAAMGWIQAG
jgi:magnesium transporter